MRPRAGALLAAALLGIATGGSALGASSSPRSYFKTTVCSALIDNKDRTTRLQITLEVVQALPAGTLVETEFQMSADKAVLKSTRGVSGNERSLTMTSPPVAEIRAGYYEAVTRVYDGADRRNVLGVHTQRCESLLDRREMGPEFR